jgi:hypothetical protein
MSGEKNNPNFRVMFGAFDLLVDEGYLVLENVEDIRTRTFTYTDRCTICDATTYETSGSMDDGYLEDLAAQFTDVMPGGKNVIGLTTTAHFAQEHADLLALMTMRSSV